MRSRSRLVLTNHVRRRMEGRRIGSSAINACFLFGRVCHARGAVIYVIGHKEVRRLEQNRIDLSRYEGVHVVCSPVGSVLTVYRNHDLRGLRPHRRRPFFRRPRQR
jgi:hypothetical protein